MKRKFLVIVCIATAFTLTGCSVGSSSNSSSSSEDAPSGTLAGPPEGAAGAGAAVPGSGGVAAALPDTQVVTTGSISLTADDPAGVADKAVALVEAGGGHVDNRTQQSASGNSIPARADLVLRVPSAKVSSTIEALKKLGTVDSVEITATDVTTQVQDVNARITALQTSVNRLLDLMSKASNTTDLIALESTLSARQADLDSLTAQRSAITDQVQYASISLGISAKEAGPAVAPSDFWSGLGIGWGSLATAVSGALLALGVLLPWIVVLGAIALIVLAVVRFAGRKARRERGSTTG